MHFAAEYARIREREATDVGRTYRHARAAEQARRRRKAERARDGRSWLARWLRPGRSGAPAGRRADSPASGQASGQAAGQASGPAT